MLVDLQPNDLIARCPDKTIEAFRSGTAVSNNGFRCKNGTIYPEQPEFIDPKEAEMSAGSTAARAAIYVGKTVVIPLVIQLGQEVVAPAVKDFVNELVAGWKQNRTAQQYEMPSVIGCEGPETRQSLDTAAVIDVSDRISRAI